MKPIICLLLLAAALPCPAQDIRCKVRPADSSQESSGSIDPDFGIYGMPYGTTEDEFIAKFGMPVGYLRLSASETAMLYGKSHAFLFNGNGLVGVRITDSLLDWKTSSAVTAQSPFDRQRWRLNNGIGPDATLAEVEQILGESLSGDKYNMHYETRTSRVELDFARYTGEGDTDQAYKVIGILVRKRSAEAQDSRQSEPPLPD
jgi:hypothetical protein